MCHVCYACINNEGAVIKQKAFKLLLCLPVIFVLALSAYSSTHPKTVHAADSNVADGITVDSTLDTADANIGDGICDDGSGNCTLRAAIEEANSDPDASTIEFNISGTPDFTNNSQDGYTISPASALPQITEQVTIDGYSQPGAQANTAVAPNPLNGTLLIELDGSGLGSASSALDFVPGSDGSAVRGLVIGNFDNNDGLKIGSDNIQIQGNYIGTDPSGAVAHPNRVGVNGTSASPDGLNALMGGLDPGDRNLISGNTSGPTATASYPAAGWVIQGNYMGVGADGITPIANAPYDGSGALSIDYADGVVVGGPEAAAANVIGANLGHGIAPDHADDLLIEGNIIGLSYDGTVILGNSVSGNGSGLALKNSDDVTFRNNHVAGWNSTGISLNGICNNVVVENNVVHDNNGENITVFSVGGNSSNISILNNIVYNSGTADFEANIRLSGVSAFTGQLDNVVIQGNKIGYLPDGSEAAPDASGGIIVSGDPTNVLIGGTQDGQGNAIQGQSNFGIRIMSLTVDVFSLSVLPQKVAILGNTVTNTSNGLGIDLLEGIDTDSSPDGNPNIFNDVGPTLNDLLDTDTGSNNYINFPVLNSVVQDGVSATIDFDLDAADSPSDTYRVEFFANDTADPSGYGEGQTYLGSATVSNGDAQSTTITLPSGTNLTGKSISATTTAVDNTTDSGFGATSEFSAVRLATVASADGGSGGQLAATGVNAALITAIASLMVLGAGVTMSRFVRAK